jgi:hypothetical protein
METRGFQFPTSRDQVVDADITARVAAALNRVLPHGFLLQIAIGLKTLLRLCTKVVYELCYKPILPSGSVRAQPVEKESLEPQTGLDLRRDPPGARSATTLPRLTTMAKRRLLGS